LQKVAVQRLKPKHARQPTQVPIHKWTEHIKSHFRGGQGAALLPAEPDFLVIAFGRSAGYSLPSLDGIEYEVRQALRSFADYTSSGEDGVGAAFFKHATVGIGERLGERVQDHLLAPVLARPSLCLSQERFLLPGKLAPIIKKRDPTQASSYHMIQSCFYCLSASVV
jgi:hypothetical protein